MSAPSLSPPAVRKRCTESCTHLLAVSKVVCKPVLRADRRPRGPSRCWQRWAQSAPALLHCWPAPPQQQTLGKGLARSRGHGGTSGPHIITVITGAIGTINKPRAILLTAGSRRQEIQPLPALGAQQACSSARRPESPGLPDPARPATGGNGAWPSCWVRWSSHPTRTHSAAGHGLGEEGERTLGVHSGWPPFPGTDLS